VYELYEPFFFRLVDSSRNMYHIDLEWRAINFFEQTIPLNAVRLHLMCDYVFSE